ncbi:hypothetical protein BDA99DRAFT_493195 [Phascolomyces articulosus]|uniref:Uncharacterized protein n=1 Tax=Phascolomyces articulosus TaxID=60185 RepID=A0AAD5KRA7_9FUNG|nr:hypothetical protein BDA99DRAFT_493195 [Phascolomyces articulosus]
MTFFFFLCSFFTTSSIFHLFPSPTFSYIFHIFFIPSLLYTTTINNKKAFFLVLKKIYIFLTLSYSLIYFFLLVSNVSYHTLKQNLFRDPKFRIK